MPSVKILIFISHSLTAHLLNVVWGYYFLSAEVFGIPLNSLLQVVAAPSPPGLVLSKGRQGNYKKSRGAVWDTGHPWGQLIGDFMGVFPGIPTINYTLKST